jgi:hypothetical protein
MDRLATNRNETSKGLFERALLRWSIADGRRLIE